MPQKQTVLFLFLFFISQFAYPNNKLLPGYYINMKGDSVQCNIEFSNWAISPGTVLVQENNGMKEFGPNEIRGFGISGHVDYVAATVTYHTDPVSGEDLPKNFTDITETKSCFLKVLKRNVYSLYSLTLPARRYLFVSYPGKSFEELLYRVKRTNEVLTEDQSYRNQILALFTKEGISQKYFGQISELSYEGPDVGALIDVLNETNTGVKIPKKSGNFQMDIFAGILQNSFPTTFKSNYSNANQFKSQISPTFGINFLYSLPGNFFKVGLSMGYNGYDCKIHNSGTYVTDQRPNYYSTSVYDETIYSKNNLLVTSLYVMCLVNPADRARCYLKGGINYNFSLTYNKSGVNVDWKRAETGLQNGTIPFKYNYGDYVEWISMKNYFVSFKCAAGVNVGRGSLEISYSPPVQIASANSDIYLSGVQPDFKVSTLGICFYYMLLH